MAGCACLVLVLIACAVSLHERTGLRAVNNNDVALSRGAKLLSAPRANKGGGREGSLEDQVPLPTCLHQSASLLSCGVDCFLKHARFALPTLKKDGVTLSNLTCDSVALGNATSRLLNANKSLDVVLSGVGFRCQGEAKVSALGMAMKGRVEVVASPEDSSVSVRLEASDDAFQMTEVRARIQVSSVTIGSTRVPAVLLVLIRDLFDEAVSVVGKRWFNEAVASAMARLNELASAPTPLFAKSPNPMPSESLDLRKSLLQSLAETSATLGPIFDRAAAALSGKRFSVPSFVPIVALDFPGSVCASVSLASVRLDKLSPVEMLLGVPAPYNVNFLVASNGKTEVSASAAIALSTPWGPTFAVNVSDGLRASMSLNADAWLSVNKDAIQAARRFTDLLASSACPPFNDLGVNGVAVEVADAELQLEIDAGILSPVVNDFASFITSSFGGKIVSALSAWAATDGRTMLNEELRSRLNLAAVRGTENCTLQRTNREGATAGIARDDGFQDNWFVDLAALGSSILTAFGPAALLSLVVWRNGNKASIVLRFFLASLALLISVAVVANGAIANLAWIWVSVSNVPSSSTLATPTLIVLTWSNLISSSWRGGACLNAFGLVFLGVVVPLVRCIAMTVLCAISLCSKQPRRFAKLLAWLEYSGKFCALMPLELILAKGAFSRSFALVANSQINVIVMLTWAFYLFLASAVLGWIGGRLIQQLVPLEEKVVVSDLEDISFAEVRYRRSDMGTMVAGVLLFVGGVCLAFGLFVPCIRFEIRGAVAKVLPLVTSAPSVRDFSVADLIGEIPAQLPFGWSNAGLWIAAVAVGLLSVGFALLVPLLLALGFIKASPRWLATLCSALQSASCAELWLLCIAGCFLELQKLASYLLLPFVGPIDALLSAFPAVFGSQAFVLSADPLLGFWFLVAGCAILAPLCLLLASPPLLARDRSGRLWTCAVKTGPLLAVNE